MTRRGLLRQAGLLGAWVLATGLVLARWHRPEPPGRELDPRQARALFAELARAEASLRRRLARPDPRRRGKPPWPWRTDDNVHRALTGPWRRLAARARVPLARIARVHDEGLRGRWPGVGHVRAGVEPLAPVPPGVPLR